MPRYGKSIVLIVLLLVPYCSPFYPYTIVSFPYCVLSIVLSLLFSFYCSLLYINHSSRDFPIENSSPFCDSPICVSLSVSLCVSPFVSPFVSAPFPSFLTASGEGCDLSGGGKASGESDVSSGRNTSSRCHERWMQRETKGGCIVRGEGCKAGGEGCKASDEECVGSDEECVVSGGYANSG